MKILRTLFFILALFVIAFIVPSAHAIEVRGGETVRIEKQEIINGSLFVGGTTVTIDGVVKGDVFCGGQRVTIAGRIDGDVICGGQMVEIIGEVTGDVRVGGQTVDIKGSVARNVNAFGQSVIIDDNAVIGGELLLGGQNLTVDGAIGKGIAGGAQTAMIRGTVGGDVSLEVERLDLGNTAKIGGALRYTSKEEALIPSSAKVSGIVARQEPKKEDTQGVVKKVVRKPEPWPVNAVPAILFYLVVGAITVLVFPKFTDRVTKTMKSSPLPTGLVGFGVLVGVPIVSILLLITILGIPLALAVIFAYIVALSVCRIFVAAVVGQYILESFKVGKASGFVWQIVVGVPILWFIFKVPVVGGFIGFFALIWSLGGFVRAFGPAKK